jgi:DNA mismatch repair ATPase MutS
LNYEHLYFRERVLEGIEARESERTGLLTKNIFNNVFGYYMKCEIRIRQSVTNGWIRKQTLVKR